MNQKPDSIKTIFVIGIRKAYLEYDIIAFEGVIRFLSEHETEK